MASMQNPVVVVPAITGTDLIDDYPLCSVPRFVRQFGLALRTCREHGGAVLMG